MSAAQQAVWADWPDRSGRPDPDSSKIRPENARCKVDASDHVQRLCVVSSHGGSTRPPRGGGGMSHDEGGVEVGVEVNTVKIRLVEGARDGDADAWQQLVATHQAVLCRIARGFRLGDSDVADVVQTTWVRCLE